MDGMATFLQAHVIIFASFTRVEHRNEVRSKNITMNRGYEDDAEAKDISWYGRSASPRRMKVVQRGNKFSFNCASTRVRFCLWLYFVRTREGRYFLERRSTGLLGADANVGRDQEFPSCTGSARDERRGKPCATSVHGAFIGTDCIVSFSSPVNRAIFDVCLEKDPLIFREEKPFIFLNESMKNGEYERPFLCSDHLKRVPPFEGTFFDILKEVGGPLGDSYCVYSGSNCTFDGMIDFVNQSALAVHGHRWVVGGLLFVLEKRISTNAIPSIPLIEDELVIIGRPAHTPFSKALDTVVKPFTFSGHIYIGVCIFVQLFVRVAVAFMFTKLNNDPFNRDELWYGLFDFNNKYKRNEKEDGPFWRRLNLFCRELHRFFSALL